MSPADATHPDPQGASRPPSKRRQFTIRQIMVVIAVISLLLGLARTPPLIGAILAVLINMIVLVMFVLGLESAFKTLRRMSVRARVGIELAFLLAILLKVGISAWTWRLPFDLHCASECRVCAQIAVGCSLRATDPRLRHACVREFVWFTRAASALSRRPSFLYALRNSLSPNS